MEVQTVKKGKVMIVKPMGKRLDASVAPEFKKTMLDLVNEGNKLLVLNLGEVDFVDSSGLGVMVSILKAVGKEGDMSICGVKDPVMSLLKLTRMDKVFRIFATEDQASEALSSA